MNTYKSDNNKLLRAFLKYQLIEIVFFIIYLTICFWHSCFSLDRIRVYAILYFFAILAIGVVFQVVTFIICWISCNLIRERLWIPAKVVVYLSLDIIPSYILFLLVRFIAEGELFVNMNSLEDEERVGEVFYRCFIILPIIILISKVLFFKYYKKRFGPKTVQETNAAIHEKVIETVNSSSSAEECYKEPEGFLCEDNLKYYDEMNYSVYADDARTVISVVFSDKSSGYCRYFTLSESDTESGYEELWRLADTIRANPQSFAEREINIEDLQKEDK